MSSLTSACANHAVRLRQCPCAAVHTDLITLLVIHAYRKAPRPPALSGRVRDDIANYLEAMMFANSSECYSATRRRVDGAAGCPPCPRQPHERLHTFQAGAHRGGTHDQAICRRSLGTACRHTIYAGGSLTCAARFFA